MERVVTDGLDMTELADGTVRFERDGWVSVELKGGGRVYFPPHRVDRVYLNLPKEPK